MKNRILKKLLLSILLASACYIATPAIAQEMPPPPPPPAKDYFPKTWDEYTSEAGKFRARFPGKPQEEVSAQGKFEKQALEYKGLLLYRVSSVDYKTTIEDPQKVKAALQGVKDAALASLKDRDMKLIAEREVTVDGHSGIFIHIEVGGKEVVRAEWVIAGSRLYMVSVDSRKGSPQEMEGQDDFAKIVEGFISSFHVLP